jgi:DNA-binding transcriptional MerR regulator
MNSEGIFQKMLLRNNKELRDDRGKQIVKAAEKMYRREVEDLNDKLEQLISDRAQLLDVNPGNTQTIINPSDFDSANFIKSHIALGLSIREIKIKLEVARSGYEELFGSPAKTE